MKAKGYITIDEIAITNKGYKVNPPNKNKWRVEYMQKMQSLYGSRKFLLTTRVSHVTVDMISITLQENKNGYWETIAKRIVNEKDEQAIHKALKSLERKAKCKLYYVLLISTDGEYL